MSAALTEYHIMPTPIGAHIVEVSNKHIIQATSTSLAIPLEDTPCPAQEFPAVRQAHNAALNGLMVERNVTRYWRYARVTGEATAIGKAVTLVGEIISGIFTCGISLCCLLLDTANAASTSKSGPANSSAATSGQMKGYAYYLVSEIPHVPQQVMDYFHDEFGMSNFAAGTAAQDCLWMTGFGEKSVAPGGGWVNLPSQTPVEFRHGWIWLYTYGGTSKVRKIEHGVSGRTTAGVAMERVMAAEREALEGLSLQGFKGRAVAVWPPVIVNGSVVA
jgi:hypothetical protein